MEDLRKYMCDVDVIAALDNMHVFAGVGENKFYVNNVVMVMLVFKWMGYIDNDMRNFETREVTAFDNLKYQGCIKPIIAKNLKKIKDQIDSAKKTESKPPADSTAKLYQEVLVRYANDWGISVDDFFEIINK